MMPLRPAYKVFVVDILLTWLGSILLRWSRGAVHQLLPAFSLCCFSFPRGPQAKVHQVNIGGRGEGAAFVYRNRLQMELNS